MTRIRTLLLLTASLALAAQDRVPALDPAGLQRALAARTWTIVEFGGPTCVPCMRMQPILAELQQHYGPRARFYNFYVTEHLKEARVHQIMVMPTQVIFDPRGREVFRHVGFWPGEVFTAALSKLGLK
ncbi:MAG: thioredoxin family protein, partial [Acidobacteriota bacterium]|nr:thioredoxin family protein [Acidobacteriota bacterium]